MVWRRVHGKLICDESIPLCLFLLMAGVGQADSLYFGFPSASLGAWAAVTAPLNGANWRVGGLGGPAATDAELLSVLSSLTGLEIGGDTGGVIPTSDSSTFALSNPNLAGLASDDFTANANGWTSTDGGVVEFSSTGGFPSGGEIVDFGMAFEQILFIAPSRYLGDKSAAFSHNLTFSFEILPGAEEALAGSDLVILTGTGAAAAPEPADLLLVGPAMLVGFVIRKGFARPGNATQSPCLPRTHARPARLP